jgi:hypothetical protein
MQKRIFDSGSTAMSCQRRLVAVLFTSIALASGSAWSACIEGQKNSPVTMPFAPQSSPSQLKISPELLSDMSKEPSDDGLSNSATLEQIDPTTGAKYVMLTDETGASVGWVDANGSTYDAQGNLFAYVDHGSGKVFYANGSVLFETQNDCNTDAILSDRKWSLDWGWLPPSVKVKFTKYETMVIADDGIIALTPICGAITLAAAPAGVACGLQAAAIVLVAREAKRKGKCVQYNVKLIPGLLPTAQYPSTRKC